MTLAKRPTSSPAVTPPRADDRPEETYRPIEWGLIVRCLGLLRPYTWRYVYGIVLCAVHVLLEMSGWIFTGYVIAYVTAYRAGETAIADAPWVWRILGTGVETSRGAAISDLLWTLVYWAAALAVSFALQRKVILIMTDAGERVQFDLRRRVFAHLQTLSMSFYDKTKLGRIISRCTSDINALREANVWGVNRVLMNAVKMIVAAGMLAATDWRLFVAVAWLGPVLAVVNVVYRRKAGSVQQEIREGFTRVSTNLAENITGMRVVTAFNRQEPNLSVFNHLQVLNTANNMRGARLNGVYQPLLVLIQFVGRAVILAVGGYLVVTGNMAGGVGAVVMAFGYWDYFMEPMLDLGNFLNMLMQAMAGGERVFALLDTKPDVTDLPDAAPLPRITGHVKFENVTFGYNPERPVLHDVSFEAEPGQMIALVGATGSGKSSIISLIARFYQPQLGRVLVDGRDIRYVTGESLHRQMGLVLQVNYLFTGTVMENIRYAKPGATEQQVIDAAKAIGSHDAIMSLARGFETEVGERGASMSLGQRQLICFTRAFLADPRIFMLDEATSAVDTGTELQIQRSLEKLLEGRTTFIVAHRLSTIMRADVILVIDAGKIIERGTHSQLLAHGGKYAHLYEQFVKHGTGDS